MFDRITAGLLRFLRVPPEPHPPAGSAGSLRIFRAGRNLYHLRIARWGLTQIFALAVIIFWIAVFLNIEIGMLEKQRISPAPPHPKEAQAANSLTSASGPPTAEAPVASGQSQSGKKAVKPPGVRINGWSGFKSLLVRLALLLPAWAFPLLWAIKIAGVLFYLVQLPITYLIVRLDYELRWYMVTDRSLRFRQGVWRISEVTMSFANLQQVVVSQGPVQRLLGLGDVRVQSAGGGGFSSPHVQGRAGEDLHLGLFHGVTNAEEIRDLILDRLKKFRESGLGDPDERKAGAITAPVTESSASEMVSAARELRDEARKLKVAVSGEP
ncbi:MAG TPA: PH domain-containing protein [Candidatus Didemnitutus sp.]|nr:PH domain-containing protein [Candidatus Didemnitutus sp.]